MQSKFYTNNSGAAVIELPSRDGDGIAIIRDVVVSEPFKTGAVKTTAGMRNGYRWHWFNWFSLTEDEKIEAGSPVWMFDEEAQVWHPQTELYTGG